MASISAFVAINHRQVTALRDRFIPKRWGVVVEGWFYRSGQLSQHLVKETLQKHHIARVVDLTFDNPQDANHVAELAAIAELGIERKLCPLDSDGTGDEHIYAQAVAAVVEARRQGKPVLVHCYAGAQRTGGVVALYRLLIEHKPPADVLREMQQYRYDPQRSPRLLEYLNEHIAAIAADLVRAGVIDKVPDPLPRLSSEDAPLRR
ncbi:MAG: tyrosine-protein phosphatase [Planctomycetia bacterium]|nr:tyrosine-protein phosphatase [Planctomycetia bacterium]